MMGRQGDARGTSVQAAAIARSLLRRPIRWSHIMEGVIERGT
jgi:hypothetical protein